MDQRHFDGENMSTPPEHLDEQGRAKWLDVLAILQGRDDLDAGTLDALACYCSAWSTWILAEAQVKTVGLVVKSPAGFAIENPYLGVARKAQVAMRQWAAELRLTPKSRKATAQTRKAAEPAKPTLRLRTK
jgi:P27 family predicted phage terminase small subunit